jgi:hypothetical protein
MKLEAVFDGNGVILAAIAFDPEDSRPRPRPVASDGNSLGEFDVPPEHINVPLDELCLRLRVDVDSGRLVDRSKGA